jgi:hypothetical protein
MKSEPISKQLKDSLYTHRKKVHWTGIVALKELQNFNLNRMN